MSDQRTGRKWCESAGCRRGTYFSGGAQSSVRIWMEDQPCFVTIYHFCGLGRMELRIERGDPPIAWWEAA